MRSATILKRLSNYLTIYDIERLKLNLVLKDTILICYTIVDICKNYNSTQENEDKVCALLSELCRNHFNAVDSKTLK